jgi:hypothetical protein
MSDNQFNSITAWITGIIIVLILGFVGYANIKCWNIPIMNRTGICAMLHQK